MVVRNSHQQRGGCAAPRHPHGRPTLIVGRRRERGGRFFAALATASAGGGRFPAAAWSVAATYRPGIAALQIAALGNGSETSAGKSDQREQGGCDSGNGVPREHGHPGVNGTDSIVRRRARRVQSELTGLRGAGVGDRRPRSDGFAPAWWPTDPAPGGSPTPDSAAYGNRGSPGQMSPCY